MRYWSSWCIQKKVITVADYCKVRKKTLQGHTIILSVGTYRQPHELLPEIPGPERWEQEPPREPVGFQKVSSHSGL